MDKLLEDMAARGFYPKNIDTNGKLVRFTKDKNLDSWVIAFDNGDIITALYGSWRDGSEFKYTSNNKMSSEQKKEFRNFINKARSNFAKEKKKEQESASEKCQDLWEMCKKEGKHDYLNNKQIKGLFGARLLRDCLYVPCKDIEGKLWGLQRIFPDGRKLFTKGQRIKGCFHHDGDLNSETLVICEGFSTGASIRQATGYTTIMCFNAGNLEEVARTIRTHNKKAKIFIAGDDDQFNAKNIGRQKAEKAAIASLGTAIFPKFKNLDAKPTDFNDLHCLEGLDVVRHQVKGAREQKPFIRCLGFCEDIYFYTSSVNQSIVKIASAGHNKHRFRDLMHDAYYQSLYPGKNGDGVDWDQVELDLKRKNHKKGFYTPDQVRGLGVWRNDGKIVANLGDRLYSEGKFYPLGEYSGTYTYILSKKVKIASEKLALEEGRVLADLCKMFSWDTEISAKYLAGWIAISQACGALSWRPHLWLTGPAGTGKSWILNNTIDPCVGAFAIQAKGGSSEAGLRQKSKNSALPIYFDELEVDRKLDLTKVQNIVQMFRLASSDDKSYVYKGTSGGDSIQYTLRFCGLASSINPTLENAADKSRVTILELKKMNDREHFKEICRKSNKIPKDFSTKLIKKLVDDFSWLDELIVHYREVLTEEFDARFSDQHSALLAGHRFLTRKPGDFDIFDAQIEVEKIKESLREQESQESSSDNYDCLSHLLDSTIKYYEDGVGMVWYSVREVIAMKRKNVLKRFGIELTFDDIMIANSHPELSKVFEKTRWEGGSWKNSLIRIQGARRKNQQRFDKFTSRATVIPLSKIENYLK